ncbi:MAG: hypothetical protein F6K42_03395, partial [Leptolyngbya sp. SIO1D8]|nr:hypothetical protein [Leptolyngbya sp. SIO1D8]
MMPEQQQRILGYFIEEAKDHLNTIEQGLLNLQATIEDPEMVNEVFRAAHSVKGGAAMLGISSMQRTAHRLEDYFKVLKESPARVDRALESMFLQVFDGLQALLEELQGPFGLTEDKAQEVMTDLEPVFEQLEQHLNTLVASSAASQPVATEPVAAVASSQPSFRQSPQSSEESALKLVFRSDVPSHLREMLALFKQADNDFSRTALQSCCAALERIGEQFDLYHWSELAATASQAIGNSEQTYRSLAPIVIKELKQAQEQILSGQAGEVSIAIELQALLPSPETLESTSDEIDALLDDTLSVSADSDLAELFESESSPSADDADLDWLDVSTPIENDSDVPDILEDDFAASLETGSESGDMAAILEDDFAISLETGDESLDDGEVTSAPDSSVGTPEFNNLADLFEGEMAGLESPWQEVPEAEAAIADDSDLDINISDDFSDLLENTLAEDSTVDAQQDLADLFNSNPLEETLPSVDEVESQSADVSAENDFADLFEDSSDTSVEESSGYPDLPPDSNQALDDLLDNLDTDSGTVEADLPDIMGDQTSTVETPLHESEHLDMEAAFNDLGDLFEEGSSSDFAVDLDSAAGIVEELSPSSSNDESPELAVDATTTIETGHNVSSEWDTANEAPTNDEVDLDLAFEDIEDPWATQEAEDENSDEIALDALDELWSETEIAHQEAEVETAPSTETDTLADIENLDLDTSPSPDEDNTLQDLSDFETGDAEDLSLLFEDDLDITDASETISADETGTTTDSDDGISDAAETLLGNDLESELGFEGLPEDSLGDDVLHLDSDLLNLLSDEESSSPETEDLASESASFSDAIDLELPADESDHPLENGDDFDNLFASSDEPPVSETSPEPLVLDLESETSDIDVSLENSEEESLSPEEETTAIIDSPEDTLDDWLADSSTESEAVSSEQADEDFFGVDSATLENLSNEETSTDFDLALENELSSTTDVSEVGESSLEELLDASSTTDENSSVEISLIEDNINDFFDNSSEPSDTFGDPDAHPVFEVVDNGLDIASATDGEQRSDELVIDELNPEETESLFEDSALGEDATDIFDDSLLEFETGTVADDTSFQAAADPLGNLDNLVSDEIISHEPESDAPLDDLDNLLADDPTNEPEANAPLDDEDARLDDEDADLDDLDSLLADDPAESPEIETPLDDLDGLLTDDPTDSPEIETPLDDLDGLLDDEPVNSSETSNPFNELDSLLADESDNNESHADFDELDALLDDEAAYDEESELAGGDVDFDGLEALLEDDTAPVTPQDVSTTQEKVEDEFGDLEKLLEEADQALGGSSPTIRSTGGVRSSRRVAAMVDQTMRVSVKHLDTLNNLVGELVVNRNSLEQDQERLRQFLDNLLFQVQQLNDVGQRMRDLYERSLLESSLISNRQVFQGTGARSSEGHTINGGSDHATGATFDALEMDRFTGFHTLSQEMIELIVRVRESASDIAYTVESSDQITRQFRQVTTQLQEGLNKARMVPFAQTADRLPRAVRDISLKCGKEARLVVEGRDTLIDKMILERLYDPMTHLVNNAITHGIETPDERAAVGKSREGTITVRAFYQGNQTVIYIADDGAGINPDIVKRKAIKKGLITQAEANAMSVLETYELLFRPGFTTREKADDFAGRGFGMDVVRTALSEIRGSITIDSEMGKG